MTRIDAQHASRTSNGVVHHCSVGTCDQAKKGGRIISDERWADYLSGRNKLGNVCEPCETNIRTKHPAYVNEANIEAVATAGNSRSRPVYACSR